MDEDDRQRAMALYNQMFDMAASEQDLIHHLSSPTRQAVLVARSYNRQSKGLSFDAKPGKSGTQKLSDPVPAYIKVIEEIRDRAFTPAVVEDQAQLTIFDFIDNTSASEVGPSEITESPVLEEMPDSSDVSEEASGQDTPLDETEEEESDSDISEPAEKNSVSAETPEMEGPALLNTLDTSHEVPCPVSEQDIPAENVSEPIDVETAKPMPSADDTEFQTFAAKMPETEDEPEEPVRKPRILLLILFVLLAIPVCLIGSAVLLIPTVICLGIAVASIFAGVAFIAAAFSGLSVIADLLVIIGASVVLLAVGLLFLWAFLWFIIGAIGGLIRGAVELGGKWCYKGGK